MAIPNPVRSRQAAAVVSLQAIISRVADRLLTPKLVPDRCLVHLVAMEASTRVARDTLTPDPVLGLVRILAIADVVIVAILEALVLDVVDT